MPKPRTIAVVTGTRAEFGLLMSVFRGIAAHPALRLRTVVAGTHLTTGTWREVREAGFGIDARVPMQRKGEVGRAADVQAIGRGVAGFGQACDKLNPDVVLVLGDRIEVFAAATAASVGGIHLAHVHGGDRAEGVADEAMRHAVSKLAHLHFSATAQSRRRLIRMGEPPEQVWNVGSPAVDGLADVKPAADAPRLIVLQHPIGETDEQERQWMAATLEAAASAVRHDPLVLLPNHDPGRAGIVQAIRDRDVEPLEHVPRQRWLALLAGAEAIVGNSSAGLIEAAVLKTACVNVGPRQAGREKPAHVVDCDYGSSAVAGAIKQALTADLRRLRHPYGTGRAGECIAQTLADVDLHAIPRRKRNSY